MPPDSELVRVLVVDDHEMVAKSLVRLLSEDPTISIIGAESTGQGGVSRALEEGADVVVMDFQLPDMDGASATRMLLQEDAAIKVIGLSGSDMVGAYKAAMEAGCSAWIRKTSAIDELLDAVHRVRLGEQVQSHELDDLPKAEDLVVHYQPIVELTTRVIVGFEALVRWNNPERGLLPPADFLPLAERTGYIMEIGQVVAHRAAAQLVSWQRAFPKSPLWLSINMSATGLSQASIVDGIAEVIRVSGVDPRDFVIEITETVLADDTPETKANAMALKNLGVGLALDDFGTAFSSLSYLRQFPFDILKIDNSFTADLPDLPRSLLLVEVVKQAADHLGLKAIAEGIERKEQAACLIDAGWTLGQGFFYSRPVDSESITRLLERALF